MRVALVTAEVDPCRLPDGRSAGSRYARIAALARALTVEGFAVVAYTRRDPAGLPCRGDACRGVPVEHLPAGSRTGLEHSISAPGDTSAVVPDTEMAPWVGAFASQLTRRWSACRPDVAHAYGLVSGIASLVAGVRTVPPVPVVVTFHSLELACQRHRCLTSRGSGTVRVRLEKAVAHDAAHLLATCSDEIADLLRLGVPRRAISVVPSGVETDWFHPGVLPALRGTGRPRLITVCRLRPGAGVDTAIGALRWVPEAELTVVGGPNRAELERDAEYRRLAGLAEAVGVADRVHFLGGVSRLELPPLLRSADVMVHLPDYEPCGLSVLEGMACGVPVVAAAVGELADSVVDGSTGVLIPPRRPDLLAGVLRRLLADPVRREGYGIAGADRARARYGWRRVVADTAEVYQQVVVGAGLSSASAR